MGDTREVARWALREEKEFCSLSMEFKLDSHYYSLRDAEKIDTNVKLLLATGLCSFICEAVQRTRHMGH